MHASIAVVGDELWSEPLEMVLDPAKLVEPGNWIVLNTFEGEFKAVRFNTRTKYTGELAINWDPVTNWRSSMDATQYQLGVLAIQEEIRNGRVYQVNLCRVLSAETVGRPNAAGLYALLRQHHHAKYLGFINIEPGLFDDEGIWFVTASPELFLFRNGSVLKSSPIKGTAVDLKSILEKDRSENIMITDMVRNDLGAISKTGSVKVDELLKPENYPGLVQLVSTVSSEIGTNIGWPEIFKQLFPAASITGAPRSTALQVINEIEKSSRNAYCGCFGYINHDQAQLSVNIRSFEYRNKQLKFGTGAGITSGSNPAGEWAETELKASKLLKLAAIKVGD